MKRLYQISFIFQILYIITSLVYLGIFKYFDLQYYDPKSLYSKWIHVFLWFGFYVLILSLFIFLLTSIKLRFPKKYLFIAIIAYLITFFIFWLNNNFINWFLD